MTIKERNDEIRKRRSNKESCGSIAKHFGITSERVRQICLNTEDKTELRRNLLTTYTKDILDEHDYVKLLNEIADLCRPDRTKEVVIQRQIVIRYLHDNLNMSFFKIGLLLNRHHASITHLYRNDVI